MQKGLLSLFCIFSFSSASKAMDKNELEEFWKPTNPDPSLWPTYLDEEKYDELVVDFKTGAMKSKEPWFIMFIKPDCGFCKWQKPKFDELVPLLKGEINIGVVNKNKAELLKETFGAEYFPFMVFLKDGKAYSYKETKAPVEDIIKFLREGYLTEASSVTDIPPRIEYWQLFLRYR